MRNFKPPLKKQSPHITTVVLYGLSLTFLVLALLPWIAAEICVIAVGAGETHRIRKTGMVSNPNDLVWTEWSDNTDHVYIGHLAPNVKQNAKVVSCRTGTDHAFFSILTFYQAKYQLPDGEVLIAPINGPVPLVSVNNERVTVVSTLFFSSFLLCILITVEKCRD